MRNLVVMLTLILIAPVLAGCLAPAADLAANRLEGTMSVPLDADGFLPVAFTNLTVGTLNVAASPTLTVHAETYLPTDPLAADAPERFPTILVLSPYFGAGQGGNVPAHPTYGWLVDTLVPRGYAVVLADSAGTGGSGGCWDFMGPDEQAAAVAIVEGIAKQDWSDGKVGMIGKSYDGMTQIMAASRAAEHLVTVVPVAPLTHAYAGLFQNGIHYGGGWVLTTTSYHQISASPPGQTQDRYPGYAQSVAKTPACVGQNTVQGNDPTGAYNDYHKARDFRPLASNVQASVFFIQGFLDPAVKPDNAFPWTSDLAVPTKMWLGQWQHDYPNATYSGRDDLYPTLHRWFDHWLKGADNGMDRELGVDVQNSLGEWRGEARWPPTDVGYTTFALGADLTLAPAPSEPGTFTLGGPTSARTLLDGPVGVAVLDGTPLTMPIHIAGMPRFDLVVASDRPGGQIIARLYDVADDASTRLVSQGGFNLQLAGGMDRAMPLTPGAPVSVSFELYPTDYVVAANHTLRLELLTVDASQWYTADPWGATLSVTTGPDGSMLVLPTVTRSADDVFLTACGVRIKDAVPDCYHEGVKDLDREERE